MKPEERTPHYHVIVIHDCWSSYWKYEMEYGVCCAHLLRELNGAEENHPSQKWPKALRKLLLKTMTNSSTVVGMKVKVSAPPNEPVFRYPFSSLYLHSWKAYRENPVQEEPSGRRRRPKRGKSLSLIDRLRNYKESVCLFVKNFAVPFDNNQAERDLRKIKGKTKVFGCFRTEEGATDFLKIMSYTGTAKKQGSNPFHTILLALSNQARACW